MSAKNCSGETPYGANCRWYSARSSSEKYTCLRSEMNSSGTMPSTQPIVSPVAPASHLVTRVERRAYCAALSSGASSPTRWHAPSIASPSEMPATSLIRLPSPAAKSVEKPNATPSVASMRSPARIMMALSAKPKPTIGTPTQTDSLSSCCRVGASGASSAAVLLSRRATQPAQLPLPLLSASMGLRARVECAREGRAGARRAARESRPRPRPFRFVAMRIDETSSGRRAAPEARGREHVGFSRHCAGPDAPAHGLFRQHVGQRAEKEPALPGHSHEARQGREEVVGEPAV